MISTGCRRRIGAGIQYHSRGPCARDEETCAELLPAYDDQPDVGRSRQDRDHTLQVGVKDLYVYPLQPHFRGVLCHDDA